ncbi:hypothetical protein RYX36_031138 [Vicia faba]
MNLLCFKPYSIYVSCFLTRFPLQKFLSRTLLGKEIESQLFLVSNITSSIRKKYVKAYIGTTPAGELKYWLAFPVSIPPLVSAPIEYQGINKQIMRIYKEKEHVEVEFTIGHIPMDDGTGK